MSEYIVRESGYPGTLSHEVVGELIRCGDCKYWSRESICDGFCSEDHMRHDDDFYCGYAEREEGEA